MPPAREPPPPRHGAARVTRRELRCATWLTLLSPVGFVIAVDWAQRWRTLIHLSGRLPWFYAIAVIEAGLVWGLLLHAASRRRGPFRHVAAVLFVLGIGLTLGGQRYFRSRYPAYLNVDVSLFSQGLGESVVNQLVADLRNLVVAHVPYLASGGVLLLAGRRWLRPRRSSVRMVRWAAPLALTAAFFVPVHHRQEQAATPDLLYLHAVGGLARSLAGLTEEASQTRPRTRASLPVPTPTLKAHPMRNVILFINESVRFDAVCNAPEPDCRRTPFSDALTRGRFPLQQLRSLSSTTAISLAVLWTGLQPTEDRDTLHTWPLIFDYARAAGWDTAYWTSQNMLFGNSRLWVEHMAVSHMASALDLDPKSHLDMGAPEELLAERVNRDVDELREPFLAVVHLSNTHFPYRNVAEGPHPFQPESAGKSAADNGLWYNYYLNAVHQQDRHVGSILSHLAGTERGRRTVVMYTSDHAEAFREHGATGHTFSLFDEEIHVPGWIDAPPGTLTIDESRALAGKRDAPTFHSDFAPTILDLIGMLDEPGLADYRRRMPGTSLLRPELTSWPLAMTNCAGVWSCAFENWAVMQGTKKYEARAWDGRYRCWDVATDPDERHELASEACAELVPFAERIFKGRRPQH